MRTLPPTLRLEARRLRAVEGASLSEIATKLGIAPTTARRWTLDIQLAADQVARLDTRMAAHRRRGNSVMVTRTRAKRLAWQAAGRARARDGDLLHQAGCLLYWAEGSKSRNRVTMANSDMNLMLLFRQFLTQRLGVEPDQMTFRLNVYTGNGLSIGEIEDRWLSALELPRSCLRKHTSTTAPHPQAVS